MKTVIDIYSQNSYKEFILPAIDNSDYIVYLDASFYHLDQPLELVLEITDGIWRLCPDVQYQISRESVRIYSSFPLEDGNMILLTTGKDEKLYLMVHAEEHLFHPFSAYSWKGIAKISIGSEPDNDIVYSYHHIISKHHAVIARTSQGGYRMVSYSSNGTYVNQEQITSDKELCYGDYINLLGMKILFLNDLLIIDDDDKDFIIKLKKISNKEREAERDLNLSRNSSHNFGPVAENPGMIYRIAPRRMSEYPLQKVTIENPPQKAASSEQSYYDSVGSSVTMAIPMLVSYSMMIYASGNSSYLNPVSMYSGIVMILLSSLFAVYWSIHRIRHGKKVYAKNEEKRVQAYEHYIEEKRCFIERMESDYRQYLLHTYPSVEEVLNYIDQPGALWGRSLLLNPGLTYRLGIGEIPCPYEFDVSIPHFTLDEDSLISLPSRLKDEHTTMKDIPITLNYYDFRRIGMVNKEDWESLLFQIVAQFIMNYPYTEVKLAFIYDGRKRQMECMNQFRWIPHVWSDDRKLRFMASDKESAEILGYELHKLLQKKQNRKVPGNQGLDSRGVSLPYYVIFLLSPELLEGELLWEYLLHDDKNGSYTAFFLGDSFETLPNTCELILEDQGDVQYVHNLKNALLDQQMHLDRIDHSLFWNVVSKVSGYRVEESGQEAGVPEKIDFLSMYDANSLEDLNVLSRWKKNRTTEHIQGMLGKKAGGKPCILDVHERYHGPHGLVAGTTGSGKSETLQTYILSLAMNYSPEDVGFFLIDYKGGGMAHLFDGLPHMVGEISNLSGSQILRAMVAIKGENLRRQRIFRENSVNNINSYTTLYKSGDVALALPHLFIIVDEFAELKKEEPEFLQELISVAQVGRSLGVHLILSTQKPSGTVSDNIWSNSRFHICLRVQDRADSVDMLHKPDAASITAAGRGYLQVGNDEVYELFQSGYSGALYQPGGSDYTDMVKRRDILGRSYGIKKTSGKTEGEEGITQLTAVKEYLSQLAEENHYKQHVQLWMPELAEEITLEDLEQASLTMAERDYLENNSSFNAAVNTAFWEEGPVFLLGMLDDMVNQCQYPYRLSLLEAGHIAIIGSVASGKSTLMQAMMYHLISHYHPSQVNLYLIDYNSRLLSAYAQAPHTGGIVYEYDEISLKRMLLFLREELKRRKRILGGGTFSQYLLSNPGALPYIILAIDGYANVKEQTKEAYEEVLIQFAKEGISNGIYLIITGAKYGYDDITRQVGENMNTVICLQLADRIDYMEFLHVRHMDISPATGIPGRGLVNDHGRVLEFQAGIAIKAESDYERLEQLKEYSRLQLLRDPESHALRIPSIPERPLWRIYASSAEFQYAIDEEEYLPVGYDKVLGSPCRIALSEIYCLLLWGEEKTGKTNLLKVLFRTVLLRKDHPEIYVFGTDIENFEAGSGGAESDGAKTKNDKQDHVHFSKNADEMIEQFRIIIKEFIRRNQLKNQWIDEGCGDMELFRRMKKELPVFAFLSDVSGLLQMIRKKDEYIYLVLRNIMEKGALHHIYFIGEVHATNDPDFIEDEVFDAMAGYETGIHLGGNLNGNSRLAFHGIPYNDMEKKTRPGEGVLSLGEEAAIPIIIPLIRD